MRLEQFVGRHVTTKVSLHSDQRGMYIPAGTVLLIQEMVGNQHFNLVWPASDGRLAANQVHYKKVFLEI